MLTWISRIDARVKPVLLAYAAAGTSKVATALVQIIALPIIAASVGLEGFGAIMAMSGVASLASLFAQGLSPSTSYAVATAIGSKDDRACGQSFWSAAALALFGMGVSTTAGLLALLWMPLPTYLVDTLTVSDSDFRLLVVAVVVHVCLVHLMMLVEGARAAFSENHVTSIFASLGSILTLFACFWGSYANWGLVGFYLAVFALPLSLQPINLVLFVIKRRNTFRPFNIDLRLLRSISTRTFRYAFATSSYSIHMHGLVIYSTALLGLQAAAIAGAIVRLCIIAHSTFLSLAHPVLPLLTRAVAGTQLREARRLLIGLALGSTLLPAVIAAIVAIVGDWIFLIWLGIDLRDSPAITLAAGALFFGYSASHLAYLALNASGDVGRLPIFFFVSAVVAISIDYFAIASPALWMPLSVSAIALTIGNGAPAALMGAKRVRQMNKNLR